MRRDYFDATFKEIEGLLRFLESGGLTDAEEREARRHLRRMLGQNQREAQRDDKPYASMLRDAVAHFEARVPGR